MLARCCVCRVGGHRLIMLDCDWNPAVDKQAMSRIWRDGQSSVCHVYRLVTNDTVEQSIFQVNICLGRAHPKKFALGIPGITMVSYMCL